MPATKHHLRRARLEDVGALEQLIPLSVRILGSQDYDAGQIEAALLDIFGVDTQLVRDGTYYVTESEAGLTGCGGWSKRWTSFGGGGAELDPRVDAVRIRGFFVHPGFARQGIGSAVLARSESDAAGYGFRRAELLATLTGERLYAARGYASGDPIEWPLDNDLTITFVPMTKRLGP